VGVGIGAFLGMSVTRITRAGLLATVLPKPGQGPSRQAREAGHFRVRLVGKGRGQRMEAIVRGKRDPGYGATARMLAESALCLTLDRDMLPDLCGILTTASAMGDALLARLPNADINLTISA
jgi:short subunit dehydrogenase-like uncharacterized protein